MANSTPLNPRPFRNLPIYEVSISASTPTGKFRELEARLPVLANLGIGIVWLMPIYPRGGNPPDKPQSDSDYCVRDYLDVDPRFGTKDDFRHFVRATHAQGLKVILDFVPNHSAWGNSLVHEHPEFYKKDSAGRIQYPEPWTDVAKFDYDNRDLWEWMAKVHEFWLREYDVDGFREDVAGDVSLEFWTWLRPRLDAIKPVYMLAEAESPNLAHVFDADYDWTLQAYCYRIARGDWPATSLDKMLADECARYPHGATRMRHLDNHDMSGMGYAWANRNHLEPSVYPYLESTSLSKKYGDGRHAFAVLTATLPNSQPMLWNGEEIGVVDHQSAPLKWQESPWTEFYTRLLHTFRQHPALQKGRFRKLRSGDDQAIYAFERTLDQDQVIVVLNLSNQMRIAVLDGMHGSYREAFTGDPMSPNDPVSLPLAPWAYRVFVKEKP